MTELRRSLVTLDDSPQVDAYSRLRVALPTPIHTVNFSYGPIPFEYDQIVVGGGTITHDQDKGSVAVAVAGAGDSAIFQSHRYHPYFGGKSQLITAAGIRGAFVGTGITVRFGYFDADNGIYFEATEVENAITRRSKYTGVVVDERIPQSAWNLDKLDGTGPSGITRVVGSAIILVIDLQLSAGRIRVGVDIDGQVAYVHEFLTSNISFQMNMSSHTLPTRVEATSTSGSGSFDISGFSVNTEGGIETFFGIPGSIQSGILTLAEDVDRLMVAIRPKLLFQGITNRATILPTGWDVLGDGTGGGGAGNIRGRVMYGITATAGAWVSAHPDSSVEYNITATGFTGGIITNGFFVVNANKAPGGIAGDFTSRLPVSLDAAGAVATEMGLIGAGLGGDADAYGSFDWKEIIR